MPERQYQVSESRKVAFYGGMIVSISGVALFLSTFFLVLGAGTSPPSNPAAIGVPAVLGVLLIAAGQGLMGIGKKGLAGSGVILDPQRARRDIEPWSRKYGGVVDDALSEVDVARRFGRLGTTDTDASESNTTGQSSPSSPVVPAPVIKVRCGSCRSLNAEEARFCNQCGAAMA